MLVILRAEPSIDASIRTCLPRSQACLDVFLANHPQPSQCYLNWTSNLLNLPVWKNFNDLNTELDLGSIRSSPRDGLTTPCRLIIRNMGDLHIVLPALNLSNLNAGILMMMQQVRLMMFSLNMVDYSMSFLLLSTWVFCWTSRGDHSKPFLLFDFWCRTLPSCLKVIGWVVVVVAYEILVSAQGPLVLGFLVLGFWG